MKCFFDYLLSTSFHLLIILPILSTFLSPSYYHLHLLDTFSAPPSRLIFFTPSPPQLSLLKLRWAGSMLRYLEAASPQICPLRGAPVLRPQQAPPSSAASPRPNPKPSSRLPSIRRGSSSPQRRMKSSPSSHSPLKLTYPPPRSLLFLPSLRGFPP